MTNTFGLEDTIGAELSHWIFGCRRIRLGASAWDDEISLLFSPLLFLQSLWTSYMLPWFVVHLGSTEVQWLALSPNSKALTRVGVEFSLSLQGLPPNCLVV